MHKISIILFLSLLTISGLFAQDMLFVKGQEADIYVGQSEQPVVHTAAQMLKGDVKSVLGIGLQIKFDVKGSYRIIAGTIGVNPELAKLDKQYKLGLSVIQNTWEAYIMKPVTINKQKVLVVAGSDSRGTAYGLLEISRLMGVSPWEWWADAEPVSKDKLPMPAAMIRKSPSVQYRGIFLNDEDWGLLPWSSQTYEPEGKARANIDVNKTGVKSVIGPKTYSRIFELMLRLRANTIWPAMHEVTVPFYFVEGAREAANRYGIVVGTAHCEPLARNSATEWDIAGTGRYNYLTNKDAIQQYWTERLKELKGSENIFTIGMRGKHDGRMEGVKTVDEYREQLTKVIADQQQLLSKYVNPKAQQLPQALIPYKEVLEVYDSGLEVPEHVTLVWPDDNFGYIRHFPTAEERKRIGGNGVYYHLSYWGRPHDYLWLGTMNPALVYQQMKQAYQSGIQKMWIVNVGDIKPIEYQTELFLDMAWDIEAVDNVEDHMQRFFQREFGKETGEALVPLMLEHYRLAHIRKPELLGNSRVYDKPRAEVSDLPWSEKQIKQRLEDYRGLSDRINKLSKSVSPERRSTFFQLAGYPVWGASQMNEKILNAQLARHGEAAWAASDMAYDSIAALTSTYNALNNGKWNKMMDFKPRNLPVFERAIRTTSEIPLAEDRKVLRAYNAADCAGVMARYPGLGYAGKAAEIAKGKSIKIQFDNMEMDSVQVEVRLLPTHAVADKKLRFSVSLDGNEPVAFNYETKEDSEEWKENVISNVALRIVTFPLRNNSKHELVFTALDQGVILDQIYILDPH